MAVTKAQIIDQIQNRIGFSRKKSAEVTETMLELMKKTLENGEDVLISGFGKFEVKEKNERRGRNPATGEDMTLAPRRVVTFKCSGKLRESINSSKEWQFNNLNAIEHFPVQPYSSIGPSNYRK